VAATLAPAAAQSCVQDCIQVHGGIGFTWEHDTNVYYRRAVGLGAAFGRAADYPQRVVDAAVSTGVRKLNIDLDPSTEKMREEIRAEVDALKAIPADQRTEAIVEGGWVLPYLPKPWGRAATPVEQIITAQEFSAGKVRRPMLGIASFLVPSIVAFGNEDQKRRFLPPTLRGEMNWCQLFSEPGAGSDLAGLSTKAVRVDGGWRITGQKIWTTLAQYAGWGALLARTEPNAPKHNGITYFLLDMASEGVTVRPLRELTGKEFFNEVFIDDVFVPDGLVLGGQPQHADRRASDHRQRRESEPGQPGPSDRAHARRPIRPDCAEPRRPVDCRGPRGQGPQHAFDAADARGWRCAAVGGDIQAALDAHRPGLRRVRVGVVRGRRSDR
jgi:alkylation response protein AidB-like acyl-CoA dehydrogenase